MGLFKKTDLVGDDYRWTEAAPDDPRRTGAVDDVELDRYEGYEVLAFVQHYVRKHALSKASGRQFECMIRSAPACCRTRKQLYAWILKNWLRYDDLPW